MAEQEAQQQDGQEQAPASEAGETPDFEQWLTEQPETVRRAYEAHTARLRGALDEERTTRKGLAKQMAELNKRAEAGENVRAEYEKAAERLQASDRKATFYESAPVGEVTNLRLAWLAANDAGLVGKDGETDWKRLRDVAPELFRKPGVPQGHAGNGALSSGPQAAPDFNTLIRRAAGRGG